MSDPSVVHFLDAGFKLCGGTCGDPRPWMMAAQPEHGTVVTCGACGDLGIMPDPGRLGEFLPKYAVQVLAPEAEGPRP